MSDDVDVVVLNLPDDPVNIPAALIFSIFAIGLDWLIFSMLRNPVSPAPLWAYFLFAPVPILMGIGAYAMRREAFTHRRRRAESASRLKACLESRHFSDLVQFCEDIALSHRATRRRLGRLTFQTVSEIEAHMNARLPSVWLFDIRLIHLAISPHQPTGRWFQDGIPVANRIESDVMRVRRIVALRCVPMLVLLMGASLAMGIIWNHEILAFLLLSFGSVGIAMYTRRLIGAPWLLNYTPDTLSLQRHAAHADPPQKIEFELANTFVFITVRNRLNTGTSDSRICNWNILSDKCDRIPVTTGVRALQTPWAKIFEQLILQD